MNLKAHVAYNFNCFVKTEGLLNVIDSQNCHIHCTYW